MAGQHTTVELGEDVLGLSHLRVLDLLPQAAACLELLARLVDQPADLLRQLAGARRREVAAAEPPGRLEEQGFAAQLASLGLAPGVAALVGGGGEELRQPGVLRRVDAA